MGAEDALRSVDRTMRVLSMLTASGSVGVSELAARTGIPKSTVHRILGALVLQSYAVHDGETGKYWTGPRLASLAATCLDVYDLSLVSRLQPVMRRLANGTGEVAYLGVLKGASVVHIDVRATCHVDYNIDTVGRVSPLHVSSMGKILLAHQPQCHAHAIISSLILKRFTPHTITDPAALLHVLAEARQTGYAANREEEEEGMCCFAVTVPEHGDPPIAALSVACPTRRLTELRQRTLVALLCESAREATQLLVNAGVVIDTRSTENGENDNPRRVEKTSGRTYVRSDVS